MVAIDKYTRTTESYGEKGAAWPFSKSERGPVDPHLDRLLLLLWAHYIQDGPHLLCNRFTVGDYLLQTTKDRILLITSKRRMLQLRGKVVELVILHTWEV